MVCTDDWQPYIVSGVFEAQKRFTNRDSPAAYARTGAGYSINLVWKKDHPARRRVISCVI